MRALLLLLPFSLVANAFHVAPRPSTFGGASLISCRGRGKLHMHMRRGPSDDTMSRSSVIIRGMGLSATGLLLLSSRPLQVRAAVKSSSLAETVAAQQQVKQCIARVMEMQKAASTGEWQKVGDVLSLPLFRGFEGTSMTLVRSEKLSAEDKVALGTIKRFGVVADAIIMLGGLESELRSGGVTIAGPAPTNIIEEEEEGEGGEGRRVNGPEANRFLRLARGALEEIDRIVTNALDE